MYENPSRIGLANFQTQAEGRRKRKNWPEGSPWLVTSFGSQRSKVKVTRLINPVTGKSHIFGMGRHTNFKLGTLIIIIIIINNVLI